MKTVIFIHFILILYQMPVEKKNVKQRPKKWYCNKAHVKKKQQQKAKKKQKQGKKTTKKGLSFFVALFFLDTIEKKRKQAKATCSLHCFCVSYLPLFCFLPTSDFLECRFSLFSLRVIFFNRPIYRINLDPVDTIVNLPWIRNH